MLTIFLALKHIKLEKRTNTLLVLVILWDLLLIKKIYKKTRVSPLNANFWFIKGLNLFCSLVNKITKKKQLDTVLRVFPTSCSSFYLQWFFPYT